MKLSKLLFETIDSNQFQKELQKAKDASNPGLFNAIHNIKKFCEINKDKINKMLSGATEIKFLGSGSYGSAFSLGDKVLKLELDSHRPETTLNQFNKQRKKGRYLPMVYDHGSLMSDMPKQWLDDYEISDKIYYSILEKMETEKVDTKYNKLLFDIILQTIKYRKLPLSDKELQTHINQTYSKEIPDMEADLRLSSNWLSKLIKDMKNLKKLQIADFHAGNMGIRRVGGEGYFVFFD